jgi:hypothetical protein
LKQYWDAKRGARRMPARADIDPADLRMHLGWLELVDVLPDCSDFRFRLLGTRINEAFGRDVTGKLVTELYAEKDPDYCAVFLSHFRTVARDCAVVYGHGSLSIVGKPFRSYDSVSLPLDRGDGTVGMILSELQFS